MRSISVKFGKSEYIDYAVYNRTTQKLVYEHGVCCAGTPQFWFKDYKDAERLLDKALKYYPDDHILTIIKRVTIENIVDTMP
jgi:hypothetical protein